MIWTFKFEQNCYSAILVLSRNLWEGFLLPASFFSHLSTFQLFQVFLKAKPQLHEKLNSRGKNWFQIVTLVTTLQKLQKLGLSKILPFQDHLHSVDCFPHCNACLPASCTWSFLTAGSPQLPQRICFFNDLELERSQLWNSVSLLVLNETYFHYKKNKLVCLSYMIWLQILKYFFLVSV